MDLILATVVPDPTREAGQTAHAAAAADFPMAGKKKLPYCGEQVAVRCHSHGIIWGGRATVIAL